jgi:hypothetical protein
MFFLVTIFNMLFALFSCEAFDSGLFACQLALNPFASFQSSKISPGDIKKIEKVPELNCGSQQEMLQFLKKLKYTKLFVSGLIATCFAIRTYRFNTLLPLVTTSLIILPNVAYVLQLNQFEKDVAHEIKIKTQGHSLPLD